MDWLEDFGYGTITGRFGGITGDGPDEDRFPDTHSKRSGTVTFRPSVPFVRYTGSGGSIMLSLDPFEAIIDNEGYLCTKMASGLPGERGVVLPASDSNVISPRNFTYSVTINFGGTNFANFNIRVNSGESMDLSHAIPVQSSAGNPVIVDNSVALEFVERVLSGDFKGEKGDPGGIPVHGQIPAEITALSQMNHADYNGIWQVGSQHALSDAPFEITQATLVEVLIGSPPNAGKQTVTDVSESWWREAQFWRSGAVSSWGPWRKYATPEDIDSAMIVERLHSSLPNIVAETDVDQLTPGDYRLQSNTVARDKDMPTGFAGFLEVRVSALTNGIMQRYTPWMPGGSYPNQQWIRTGSTNGTFSAWTRVGSIQSEDIETIRVTTNPGEVGGPGELLIVVES